MTHELELLTVALLAGACGNAAPVRTAEPAPGGPIGDIAGVDFSGPLLPAGDWYSGHNYATCWDCPTPAAVVVLDVCGDTAAAERAVAAVPAGVLPPGYPLAAHTDELPLVGDSRVGIVVVLGQFETLEQARAWRERTSPAFPGAERCGCSGRRAGAWDRGGGRRAMRIQATTGSAFARADAGALGYIGYATAAATSRAVVPRRASPCRPPGAIFVTADEASSAPTTEWLPVRCGGEPPSSPGDSLFAATVHRARTAAGSCARRSGPIDVPTFEECYDGHGRRPPNAVARSRWTCPRRAGIRLLEGRPGRLPVLGRRWFHPPPRSLRSLRTARSHFDHGPHGATMLTLHRVIAVGLTVIISRWSSYGSGSLSRQWRARWRRRRRGRSRRRSASVGGRCCATRSSASDPRRCGTCRAIRTGAGRSSGC